ncbi:MAG: hypothetical protein AB7G06_04150 [Bdellovibrionales bacterium]
MVQVNVSLLVSDALDGLHGIDAFYHKPVSLVPPQTLRAYKHAARSLHTVAEHYLGLVANDDEPIAAIRKDPEFHTFMRAAMAAVANIQHMGWRAAPPETHYLYCSHTLLLGRLLLLAPEMMQQVKGDAAFLTNFQHIVSNSTLRATQLYQRIEKDVVTFAKATGEDNATHMRHDITAIFLGLSPEAGKLKISAMASPVFS